MSFTLTNYWWLLIWLFTGGLFIAYTYPKKYEIVAGKRVRRWKLGPAIALVVPYIVWAGCRGYFGDTYTYERWFYKIPTEAEKWGAFLAGETKDTGFSVLALIIKCFVGNSSMWYFMVLAAIQMICLVVILRKYSCNYWLSIFIFITTTDYLSWMYNGIRQYTAVIMIFAATDWILQKKYIRVLAVILLASTIHGTALLMIPIIYMMQGKAWNKKMLLCLVVSIAALLFVDKFTDILDVALSDTQYTNVVSDWKEWQDDGMNPIRVLVYAVPMLLSLVGFKIIKAEDDPVINLCVNASIITAALGIIAMGTSGIFMGRLPIYVSLYATGILLPWELEYLFTEDTGRTVKHGAILCYIVFFYYQMHFTWAVL